MPDDAATLARHDREYQRAAALDYGGETTAAVDAFEEIARSSSVWADIARYRAALVHVRAGVADAADLKQRLAQTSDAKARRGLGQLLDRVELFPDRVVPMLFGPGHQQALILAASRQGPLPESHCRESHGVREGQPIGSSANSFFVFPKSPWTLERAIAVWRQLQAAKS